MFDPKRHFVDLSTSTVASSVATFLDGVAFASMLTLAALPGEYEVGLAAALATVFGGIVHFLLCRYWVFQRYDKPLLTSVAGYVLMSGGAAIAHGMTTHAIAVLSDASVAWMVSKVLIFLFWTYPVSRFFVFGELREEVN